MILTGLATKIKHQLRGRRRPRALLIIASVALIGILLLSFALAAGPSLYLSPVNTTVTQNNTFSVAVRVNTGGEGVNAIQSNLIYPASQLEYVSTNNSSSAFPLDAETSGGGGNVRLARGTNGGASPVTGDHLVATVTFRALSGSGSASVTFSGDSAIVRASDNSNVLSTTSGGGYSFNSPSAPPSSNPSAPVSGPAPSSSQTSQSNLTNKPVNNTTTNPTILPTPNNVPGNNSQIPTTEIQGPSAPSSTPLSQSHAAAAQPKKSKTAIIIGITALFLAISGAIVFVGLHLYHSQYYHKPEPTTESTSSRIFVGGQGMTPPPIVPPSHQTPHTPPKENENDHISSNDNP